MRRSSLSSLARGNACLGSLVLPQIRRAGGSEVGSAVHDFLERRVNVSAAAAFDARDAIADRWQLADEDRDEYERLTRRFDPAIPEGAIAEVPIVLLADGSVRPAVGARGEYDVPADAVIAGTLDLVWSEPEPLVVERDADGRLVAARCPTGSTLVVVDWKTGDAEWVAPARVNAQVRSGAMLAARWTGATRAVAGVCFVRPGPGAWDMGPAMGPGELAAIERDLVTQAERERDEHARVATGEPPRLTTGPHCDWCGSRPLCPAHVAEARALAAMDAPSMLARPLTTEEASKVAGILASVRRVVEKADAALRLHVAANGPIPLADGRVWGPEPTTRVAYDAGRTVDALAEEIGREAASAAVSVSASSIERAIAAAHEAAGIKRQVAPTKRRVLEAIRAHDGVTETPSERWTAHWEKAAAE